MSDSRENLLKIFQKDESVLRQVARELTVEQILSKDIQELIYRMQQTLRQIRGVGLAAPQVGRDIQLIIIEDLEAYHRVWTAEQLLERGRVAVDFHVIINPKLYIEEGSPALFMEACLSDAGQIGLVPRASGVRVECLDEHAQPRVIQARGWYARILQHEIDHLHGILCCDKTIEGTRMSMDEFFAHWKEKPIQELQEKLCN